MNAPFLDPKTVEKRRRHAQMRATLVRWHRWIGVSAAFFTLLLSVSGILLSHAERFKLHETTLAPFLANALYDTAPSVRPIGVETSLGWLVWLERSLFLNDRPLAQQLDSLHGVVETAEVIAIAGDRELLLYTHEGEFIEKLNGAVLPAVPERIGLTADRTFVMESAGICYSVSPDFFEWSTLDLQGRPVNWSAPTQALPKRVQDTAYKLYGFNDVTTHRFVADLHSGRSFGPYGPFIMDAAALLLILLSVSGFYLWWRQRAARPRKPRPDKL